MNARAAVRRVASLDVVNVVVSLDVVYIILSFGAVDALVSLGVVGAVEVSVRAEVSELSQTQEVGAAHPHHSLTAQGVGQVQQAFQVAVWGSQSNSWPLPCVQQHTSRQDNQNCHRQDPNI